MPRCKICHVESPLDRSGRCESCIDAAEATSLGLHYGDYIARKERGTLPPTPRRDRFAAALLDYKEHVELPKCSICGGNVFPPRRYLCSPKCQAEYNRRSASEAHAKAKAKRLAQPIPERYCTICGKLITNPRKKVTCSPECAVTYKRQWERDRKRRLKQKGNAK